MLICCRCRIEMLCEKNDVAADFGRGHVYAGDRFRCDGCGTTILKANDKANVDPEYKMHDEYLAIAQGDAVPPHDAAAKPFVAGWCIEDVIETARGDFGKEIAPEDAKLVYEEFLNGADDIMWLGLERIQDIIERVMEWTLSDDQDDDDAAAPIEQEGQP